MPDLTSTGTLQSGVFTVASHFLAYWLAGSVGATVDGHAGTGFELWTEVDPGELDSGPIAFAGTRAFRRRLTRDPSAMPRWRQAPVGNSFSHVVLDVSEWTGRRAFVRIVDDSSDGRIAVDDIACTDDGTPKHPPVMGFVDTHTHPMAHQGFGGLHGIRTMWGVPGGSLDGYDAGVEAIARDLPPCDGEGHSGGPTAPFIIAGLNGDDPAATLLSGSGHDVYDVHEARLRPDFRRGAHQTMHITEIRRAFEGGLRIMSALALTNVGSEFIVSRLAPAAREVREEIVSDRAVLLAFECGMEQLAEMNKTWMAIARSPMQARDIIASDRLAVVLGTELDSNGELRVGTDFDSPDSEINWLLEHGFRQIIPIHAYDNTLGGAACFQDVYNAGEDLANRYKLDRLPGDRPERFAISGATDDGWDAAHFMQVDEAGCRTSWGTISDWSDEVGNCVLYHFAPMQNRAAIGLLGRRQPWLAAAPGPLYGFERTSTGANVPRVGMINHEGLSIAGKAYVDTLFHHGVLVDIAHMSDRSVSDALGRARAFANQACSDLPEGSSVDSHAMSNAAGDPWRHLGDRCAQAMPPVLSSHTFFRAQSLDRHSIARWESPLGPVAALLPFYHSVDEPDFEGTTNIDFVPSEYETSEIHARVIVQIQGLLNPFLGQDPIDPRRGRPPVPAEYLDLANCGRSSGNHVLAYRYGLEVLGADSMGIATDFGFHPMTSPRFGANACWVPNPDGTNPEELHRPEGFRIERQGYAVHYQRRDDAPVEDASIPVREAQPVMRNYEMGAMTFDFNVDGLANYGLVPDQLQDETNIGLGRAASSAVWRSAEAYLQMWEKAWRLAGCNDDPSRCGGRNPIVSADTDADGGACGRVCQGSCPANPSPATAGPVDGGFANDPGDQDFVH